jgi:hypothetical protein
MSNKNVLLLLRQIKYAKIIEIEKPFEITNLIMGKKLTDFSVLTREGYKKEKNKEDSYLFQDPYCAVEEIFMDFQGKEMRIFIDKETKKLTVYSD